MYLISFTCKIRCCHDNLKDASESGGIDQTEVKHRLLQMIGSDESNQSSDCASKNQSESTINVKENLREDKNNESSSYIRN